MASPSRLVWWGLALTTCFVCIDIVNSQVNPHNLVPNPIKVVELRKQLLYPYPKLHLKKEITNEQARIQIQFNFNFPFFGFRFNYTWVSLWGNLKFSDGDDTQTYPLKFPNNEWPYKKDPALIGVFYAQALIGRGDNAVAEDLTPPGVYFKTYENIGASKVQEEIDLQEAIRLDIQHGMIGTTDFTPKHVILVTWKNITFGGSANPRKTNTYQLMIATDEYRTYTVFNYQNITWTSATAAQGNNDGSTGTAAYVGFNAGNGTRAFEYKPFSQTNRVLQLVNLGQINSHPGRHIFRVDELIYRGSCNFEPEKFPRLTISPEMGHMLGGTIVNITGPCFDAKQRIKVKFHDVEVVCVYRNRNLATCQTPPVYIAGYIDVAAMIGEGSFQFRNKFYIENPMVSTELVWFEDRTKMNSLDLSSFNLYWSKSNISYTENKNVQISLWGYRESGMRPELAFIRNLAEGNNNGRVLLEIPSDSDDGWMREFKVGLIQVNASYVKDESIAGTTLYSTLWSRPIPLAWYFHKQWVRHYGDDWPAKFCKSWEMDDARLKNFAHRVPRCPCTKEQAESDKGRFAPDFGCDEHGNQECYGNRKIITCFRSGQPSQEGGGQQCCYSAENLLVLNADIKEGGFPSRSHPFGVYPYDDPTKVPGLSHWYHDMSAFYSCCIWQEEMSEGCYQFKWRRASQDCVGYQPPNSSVVFGDPHILTFDNSEYTFNGIGEFALVDVHSKAHDLEVQARFEQYIDEQKGLKMNASILTAVVMKDNSSSKVEVQLRPLEARWRYRMNVLVDEKNIYFDRSAQMIQSFKGVTVYTPSSIKDQSVIVAMFQSGAGVEVIETNGYIAARVYLPKSFMNLTRGLMGNWSNRGDDDLVLPTSVDGENYAVLPTDSFEQVHRQFGLAWVVTDAGDGRLGSISNFYHEVGRAGNSYFNKSFVPNYLKYPPLLPESQIDEKALSSMCGDKDNKVTYQCRFDYITTGNKELAASTQKALVDYTNLKQYRLKTVVTCGALQTPMFGRKSTAEYKVGSEVSFECQKGYILEGEPIRWCYAAGVWSWTEYGKTRCTPEETYYGRQAGITTGVVLGVLIPCIIGGICLFGFIYGKGASPSQNANRHWSTSNSRTPNEFPLQTKDKKGQIETEA